MTSVTITTRLRWVEWGHIRYHQWCLTLFRGSLRRLTVSGVRVPFLLTRRAQSRLTFPLDKRSLLLIFLVILLFSQPSRVGLVLTPGMLLLDVTLTVPQNSLLMVPFLFLLTVTRFSPNFVILLFRVKFTQKIPLLITVGLNHFRVQLIQIWSRRFPLSERFLITVGQTISGRSQRRWRGRGDSRTWWWWLMRCHWRLRLTRRWRKLFRTTFRQSPRDWWRVIMSVTLISGRDRPGRRSLGGSQICGRR